MKWEDDFRKYLLKLNSKKGVIVCGDLNVAHKEIDLKNPKTNRKNAGFTDQEREREVLHEKKYEKNIGIRTGLVDASSACSDGAS